MDEPATPRWWRAVKNLVTEEDWGYVPGMVRVPFFKIVIKITKRSHDGYCSDVDDKKHHGVFRDTDMIETVYKMVGMLPLRDSSGNPWTITVDPFDPGWWCPTDGSGVCGIRSSVQFVSMEAME